MARDAIAFLAEMEFGQADVLGFSIGSFVAQGIAPIRPSVLRRLTLASSAPQERPECKAVSQTSSTRSAYPRLTPKGSSTCSIPGRRRAEPTLWRAGISADVRQDAGPGPADNLDHPAGPVRRGLRLGIPDHALLQLPSAISQPVFVVNGDSDPMILPHYSYLLAGLILQAQVRIYPDSAHGFLFPAPHRVRRRCRGIPQRSWPGPRRANLLTFSTMQNRAAPLIIQAKAAAASASPESTERPVRGGTDSRNDDRGCRPYQADLGRYGGHCW
jgi:pimeloyl-ACP methyl ester carboxylesterase